MRPPGEERGAQVSMLALRQQGVEVSAQLCRVAPVTHAVGAETIGATCNLADPVGRIASHTSYRCRGHSLR